MGALESMLPKAAQAGDDWGWKGGKPGEVTAGSIQYDYEDLHKLGTQILKSKGTLGKVARELQTKGTGVKDPRQIGAHYRFALAALEDADVPREWTGKIAAVARDLLGNFGGAEQRRQANALLNLRLDSRNRPLPHQLADSISDGMRSLYVKGDPNLTKERRETFLALLPEWSESLKDLARLARNI
jgi:hypothetical protein